MTAEGAERHSHATVLGASTIVTVFLSYPSEQGEAATRIELSLKGEGYAVFRDRSSLPPGESFDARIRAAIEESDLFVFLITHESISPGRYTLTELTFAEQKWGHPAGHVLPVLIEPVPKDAIPAFLRAVTMLVPKGNVTAEVAAEVARMTAPWWRRMLAPKRLVPTIIVVLILAGGAWMVLPSYLERREQAARAGALLKQSQSKADAGDHASAWELLDQANAVAPASSDVFEAQERLAMKLLRGAGVTYWGSSRARYEDLVNKTLPVLSRGTSVAKGEHLANLLAHMGWADYLRGSAIGGPVPAEHYRRALDVDARNVYAHAMWGFESLRQRGSPAALVEAKRHFSAALESRQEREYVRSLQISALLQTYTNVWIEDSERQNEAIRVANEMRINGETRPKGWGPGSFKHKLWPIYHFAFITEDHQAPILAALPPAEHLSLFRWLFPEDDLPEGAPSLFNFLVVLAQLQEHAGDRAGALATYRRVQSEFANRKYTSNRAIKMGTDANAAIKRLSS